MTNVPWNTRLGLRLPGSRLATLGLSFWTVLLLGAGCPTRKEVDAELWLNTGIPPELCDSQPLLKTTGIYRKLDSGKTEFISYCTETPDATGAPHPALENYTTINTQKFKSFLDVILPGQNTQSVLRAR